MDFGEDSLPDSPPPSAQGSAQDPLHVSVATPEVPTDAISTAPAPITRASSPPAGEPLRSRVRIRPTNGTIVPSEPGLLLSHSVPVFASGSPALGEQSVAVYAMTLLVVRGVAAGAYYHGEMYESVGIIFTADDEHQEGTAFYFEVIYQARRL